MEGENGGRINVARDRGCSFNYIQITKAVSPPDPRSHGKRAENAI